MWTRDAGPGAGRARRAGARGVAPGAADRRRAGVAVASSAAVDDIVTVLLEAFAVDEDRRAGVAVETAASLADPRFTHYLVRLDGEPVAVARRATFDGLSYLSSIGTLERARGLGLGRRITAAAMADGFAAGSEIVHLGVFADNAAGDRAVPPTRFAFHGDPGPDMVLIG